MNRVLILQVVLRLVGTSSLFALIFVVVPHSAMDAIHTSIGMGELPDIPVIQYLARSTSLLYALLGGLFWVVSFDLSRHRAVLIYLGGAVTLFGVTLLIIDWMAGMPRLWTAWEGPFVMVFGLLVLWLARSIEETNDAGD